MELKEIKEKICDMRFSIEELADECFKLWKECGDPHTESVADFLHYELTAVACKLSDLEETEEQETDIDLEAESIEDAEAIADWWDELGLVSKCDLANIPYPNTEYGRGDDYIEAEERANKWWYSRTYEQQKEIYAENLAWWDKE